MLPICLASSKLSMMRDMRDAPGGVLSNSKLLACQKHRNRKISGSGNAKHFREASLSEHNPS